MKMKKITDERLILQNLKNIRILFVVQNIGIIGILIYDLISGGFDGMTNNPLWFVFMISIVIFAYLSMSISIENEENDSSPQRGLKVSLVVLALASIVTFSISVIDGLSIVNGLIISGVIFICGFIPLFYIYKLRKNNKLVITKGEGKVD